MAIGLYVLPNASVMVAYGPRHIPISCAQYKANAYTPVLEKLAAKSPGANGRLSVLRSLAQIVALASEPAHPRSRIAISRVTIAPCTLFRARGGAPGQDADLVDHIVMSGKRKRL